MSNRIRDISPTVRRIDPAEFAAALGAEPGGAVPASPHPLARYTAGAERYRQERERGRVALGAPEWAQLKALAVALADGKTAPSPQQVGSALLHLALRSAEPATLLESLRRELGASAVAQAG